MSSLGDRACALAASALADVATVRGAAASGRGLVAMPTFFLLVRPLHSSARRLRVLAPLVLALAFGGTANAGGPWLDRVRAFEPGLSAGFGADLLPQIVRGRPEGLGPNQGSVDVVSLGHGGRIVVSFDNNAVVDGEGDDLVIYENAFLTGSSVFAELAYVEVSADGRNWVEFPSDDVTWEGLAGRAPVLSSTANGLDPLDPDSGGDRFDLADVGLEFVRFVRITDAGDSIADPGNRTFPGTKGGFDLDAAGAIHSTNLGCISGTVGNAGEPVVGARVVLKADGEKRRRRRTRADGRYGFCRLRPGLDYDVIGKMDDVGTDRGRVYIGQEQLRVHLDLTLN